MTTSPEPHLTIAHRVPGWSGTHIEEFDPDYEQRNAEWKRRYGRDNEWENERRANRPKDPTRDWFVYEVEPLYDPVYCRSNQEWQTRAARVIRNIGKGRSFLTKPGRKPSYPREQALEKRLQDKRAKRKERKQEEALLRQVIGMMCEMRGRSFYRELLKKYPNVPEYVMHDIFRGDDDAIFARFNRLVWKNEVLEVNPSDFSLDTQVQFVSRQFGKANPLNVPEDERRMALQRSLAVQATNEPIVVVKRTDGYGLWEGWHRTMSILKLGDNGGEPNDWDKVKINAWVGSPRK